MYNFTLLLYISPVYLQVRNLQRRCCARVIFHVSYVENVLIEQALPNLFFIKIPKHCQRCYKMLFQLEHCSTLPYSSAATAYSIYILLRFRTALIHQTIHLSDASSEQLKPETRLIRKKKTRKAFRLKKNSNCLLRKFLELQGFSILFRKHWINRTSLKVR